MSSKLGPFYHAWDSHLAMKKILDNNSMSINRNFTPRISINNLRMGPREHIGQLQIINGENEDLFSSHRLVKKDVRIAGSHIPQNFRRQFTFRYYILAANDKNERIHFGKRIKD